MPSYVKTVTFDCADALVTAENRLHFDLRAPGPVKDEVARLIALGAVILRRGDDLTVMSDPEGNEFCVE